MWKILTIFERKFILFVRKCNDFCKKIVGFFQENLQTFTGKFNGFSRELGRFLHESLMFFSGTFDDFSGKFDDFGSKICWFSFPASPRVFYHNNSHPSKTRQILLQRTVKFSYKNSQIFLKNLEIFSANPVKFFRN